MTGDLPTTAAAVPMFWMTIGVVAVSSLILVSGKSVERVLERMSWVMVCFIFCFLVVVNCVFVPAADWLRTLRGFVQFGSLPHDVDWILLAVFAALAGSGGVGNLAISSWFRDKGFGMGGRVGSIGGALFGNDVQLAAVGKTFPLNATNLRRWNLWWTYSRIDQSLLWAGGCMIGMFLTVNLAVAIVPQNSPISGVAAGVFQVDHMRQLWSGFWLLGLLNGLWILLSTQLANTDCLVRTITDISWAASPKIRRWHVGRVYGVLLLIVSVLGCFGALLGNARTLLMILGADGRADHGDRFLADLASQYAFTAATATAAMVAPAGPSVVRHVLHRNRRSSAAAVVAGCLAKRHVAKQNKVDMAVPACNACRRAKWLLMVRAAAIVTTSFMFLL